MTQVIIPEFDLSMKKKKKSSKKKKKTIEKKIDELIIEEKKEEEPPQTIEEFDFSKTKRKKKPREVKISTSEPECLEEMSDKKTSETQKKIEGDDSSWAGSDRDYKYEELLDRIFDLLHNHNPDFANRQKLFVMKPPQVCREGTKKTVWVNFAELCESMNRKLDHFLSYVLAELGTEGSVDGNQRLVIKGRFQPKQIENVIRHYINEYVSCWTCKSPDTTIKKENRIYFVVCESCGSQRSVSNIKKGFEAQIGKRRNKKVR